MIETGESPDSNYPPEDKDVSDGATSSLIANLADDDRMVHVKACNSLVDMGEDCMNTLIKALTDPRERVRWGAAKALDRINVSWGKHADKSTIAALIADLGSKDGIIRTQARKSLVSIGKSTVGSLVEALASKKVAVRWEAAKALASIGDADAAQALVNALRDDEFDVRWLAAEGLIRIGRNALEPLLHALIKYPDSYWLQEGAHHVLHDIDNSNLDTVVQPLLQGLEDMVPSVEVPPLAEAALRELASTDK